MKLLNEDTNSSFSELTLLLTREEASELRDSLEAILDSDEIARHEHISSRDFQKKITIAIYNEVNTGAFNKRIRELIQEDK